MSQGAGFPSLRADYANWTAMSSSLLELRGDLNLVVEHVAETQDLSASIEVHGRDEVARLASSFNEMLDALNLSRVQQRQLVAPRPLARDGEQGSRLALSQVVTDGLPRLRLVAECAEQVVGARFC